MEIKVCLTSEWNEKTWENYCTSFNNVFKKNLKVYDFKQKYTTVTDGYSYHAILYNDDHEIVGSCTVVPFIYKKSTELIKIGQAVDVFILEEYRTEPLMLRRMYMKLKKCLINNKIVRKRSTYFKEKKAKPNKALSACIDLKKELAKLTKDPKSKSPELYVWGAKWNMETTAYAITGAIESNIYWIEKQKIPKSSCDYLIVDLNGKNYLTEDYVAKLLKK